MKRAGIVLPVFAGTPDEGDDIMTIKANAPKVLGFSSGGRTKSDRVQPCHGDLFLPGVRCGEGDLGQSVLPTLPRLCILMLFSKGDRHQLRLHVCSVKTLCHQASVRHLSRDSYSANMRGK